MGKSMKTSQWLTGFLILLAGTGCITIGPQRSQQDPRKVEGTLERMTEEDVLRMVQAGFSTQVILAQIEATDSVFVLSVDDLVRLKEEGVPDRVLEGMIRTVWAR